MSSLFPDRGEGSNENEEIYELCAVMVHEGENAHYGHFYDIIKHPFTNTWFKYNDEVIFLTPRNLQHVTEAKIPGVDKERDGGISKPTADLKECYGLVYRKLEKGSRLRYPPDAIKMTIVKDVSPLARGGQNSNFIALVLVERQV